MKKNFKCLFVIFIIILIFSVILKNRKVNTMSTFNDDKQELFSPYYEKAIAIVDNMSLEEKVGQLFLVRYDNTLAINEVNNYFPGGYILFAKDFSNHTKSSIKGELENLQRKSKISLILGVDEEGGTVTRVSRFSNFRDSKFLSPQEIYNIGGYELLESNEKEKAKLLLSLGINLNLAPVADVSTNPNDFIYDRSFGMDAKQTAKYVSNMVKYANESSISSCLKHFPGYGNNLDTHNSVVIDNRSYNTFLNSDFLPFKSGIEAHVPVILISHNIVKNIDSIYPASLSKKAHDILREDLGFSGIIMTDDLNMGAVSKYVDNNEAATLAINSGNDMIITSNFIDMRDEIINNVNSGKISISTIDLSVKRILAWKFTYNIIR